MHQLHCQPSAAVNSGTSLHEGTFGTAPNRSDSTVFINGRFVPSTEAQISVFDHAFQYGDGIYETLIARSGYIFNLDRHVARLYQSASSISLQLPLSSGEIGEVIVECVRRNGFEDAFIKCVVSRGEGEEPVVNHGDLATSIVIIPRELKPGWDQANEAGFRVHLSSVRKVPAASIDPRIKSLNYLPVVLARIEAEKLGFDDAIMLDISGKVAEGSIYNIFVLRNEQWVTPRDGILEGITREVVIDLAGETNLNLAAGDLWPNDLYLADELFFCNTSRGILPVVEVDGKPIGSGRAGPITMQLRNLYLERLNSGWMGTPVFS